MVSTGEQSRERLRTRAWGCGEVTTRRASQTHLASHPPTPEQHFSARYKEMPFITEADRDGETEENENPVTPPSRDAPCPCFSSSSFLFKKITIYTLKK